MPTSAATGTMHLHTTGGGDAQEAQEAPQAEDAPLLGGAMKSETVEKTWDDRADTATGRVSRARRAAAQERRRREAPEYVAEPEPVKAVKAVKATKKS